MTTFLKFTSILRITIILLFFLCSGYMFFKEITNTAGLEIIFLKFIVVILFLLSLIIPAKNKPSYWHALADNFYIILLGLLLILSGIWIRNRIQNSSPVRFKAEYFNEEQVLIEFRENMTFKVINSNIVSSTIHHGAYVEKESFIILKNTVRFGQARFKDTLLITPKGLEFSLIQPWRNVEQGILYFKN